MRRGGRGKRRGDGTSRWMEDKGEESATGMMSLSAVL